MSVLGKKWVLKTETPAKPILDILLENRGILSDEEKKLFLDEDDSKTFHDPFLMKDMLRTVDRIMEAVSKQEKIIIFGDYDVDGITSAAIMYHTLKHFGADCEIILPNREKDGYGLSKKFIDEFVSANINLIITVDCGVSCEKEILYAKLKGIEVIITDHHSIPESLPEAFSINHPKLPDSEYPFKDLTGAGVALKVAHALFIHNFGEEQAGKEIENLIELAALGTIADIGIAQGENRLIIKRGLKNLLNTSYPGLRILKEFAGIQTDAQQQSRPGITPPATKARTSPAAHMKPGLNFPDPEITALTVGFQIAPRINAACRIGDPYCALTLLISEDEKELYECGKRLEELNQKRQKMTEETFFEVFDKFEHMRNDGNLPYILIAESENWHVGIIGLAASRLVERFGRPAIIMQDLGDTFTASARSIEGFNITEAIGNFKDLLIAFGGHQEAAGFSIKKENLKKFKEELEAYTSKTLKDKDLRPALFIDCALDEKHINEDLIKDIWKLKPFGVRNARPLFMIRNVKPHFVEVVGKNGGHVKFTAEIEKSNFPVIGFKLGEYTDFLKNSDNLDIACHIDFNVWNGKKTLQLEVVDFR